MPAQPKSTIPTIAINLIPQDPFLESIPGKFLTWALSVGRYIVVFTELIVILTFLSRFQLDRELTDLNEQILQQVAIIESYEATEPKYLNLQKQTNFILQKQQNESIVSTLTMLEKTLPLDVKLEDLNLHQGSWSINAQSLSAHGMKQAINQIMTLNPQSNVSVNSVRLDNRTNVIKFEMRVSAKTVKAEKPSQAK